MSKWTLSCVGIWLAFRTLQRMVAVLLKMDIGVILAVLNSCVQKLCYLHQSSSARDAYIL